MSRSRHAAWAAFVACVAAPRPLPAWAEGACPGVAVEADAAFRNRAPGLLERIRGELGARSDLDTCAHVALSVEQETLIAVEVTLPDGRSAARHVTRTDDVVSTLQALLLVPPRALPKPLRESPPARAAPRRRTPSTATPTHDRAEPLPDATPRTFGIELSAITGARIGDGQFGVGAGVLSVLELGGWLVGFEGRADGYRPIAGGDPETVLELAALGGKRFDLGNVSLDLTAGPGMAMDGNAISESETRRVNMADAEMDGPTPTPFVMRDSHSGPVPRLLIGARLGFSPRSVLRTFLGLDGEFGPTQGANSDKRDGSLPRFALGLAFGATVGTP